MPLSFYIKNSSYAKITSPITKPVFDNYKADIYCNKISRKKK